MKGKILIVDDEADLRELLKSVLESDYVVTAAESAAASVAGPVPLALASA